jgi:hypothetical protein
MGLEGENKEEFDKVKKKNSTRQKRSFVEE